MEKRTGKVIGVSGVEYEIRELETKHQEIMTDGGGQFDGSNLNKIYADCITKVGGIGMPLDEKDRLEVVGKMPSADRKKTLFHMRQLAVGDIFPTFDFDYKWEVYEDGQKKIETTQHTLEIDVNNFEETPYKKRTEEGDLEEVNVTDINVFPFTHEIRAPRSGYLVKFNVLDGRLEGVVASTKTKDRNSSTLVNARNPVYLSNEEGLKDEDSTNPVWIKFDKRPMADTEVLKKEMGIIEGDFDTTMVIEHPKREGLTATVNLLSLINFFFPSGAMA